MSNKLHVEKRATHRIHFNKDFIHRKNSSRGSAFYNNLQGHPYKKHSK